MWLKLPACLNGSGCCEMHPSIEPSIRPLAFARCTLSSKSKSMQFAICCWNDRELEREQTWIKCTKTTTKTRATSKNESATKRNLKQSTRSCVREKWLGWERLCVWERHYQTKSFCLYRTQRICYGTIISTESFCSPPNIAHHKIEQPMNKLPTNQMVCEKERVEEKSQRQCYRRTQLNKIYELIFRTLLYFFRIIRYNAPRAFLFLQCSSRNAWSKS